MYRFYSQRNASASLLFAAGTCRECTLRKRSGNVSETFTWNLSDGGKGKKRRTGGMGMARANVNGKGVAAPISCSCAPRFLYSWQLKPALCCLAPGRSWPDRIERPARPTRCHPKTNNNARVSLPGGPLLFSKRRQVDFTFVMYISPYRAVSSLNEQWI